MENIRSKQSIWLVNLLLNYRYLTLKEIDEHWRLAVDLSGGLPMTRLKMHRAVSAALDNLGVVIECDRRNNYRYHIVANENSQVAEWLISSHVVNEVITRSTHLRNRILLEEIPSGQFHLSSILSAMDSGLAFEMVYQKFVDTAPVTCFIEPYCVKLSHQRWYLLGRKDHRDYLQVFSLDRIQQIRVLSDAPFSPPADFSGSEYFSYYFGVHTGSNLQPSLVRIRTDVFWRNYLRTLPLHSSQREVEITDNGSVFEFVLAITPDLVNHLLTYRESIEVLEPESLREQLRDVIARMYSLYNK